jgi:hypothetical protein
MEIDVTIGEDSLNLNVNDPYGFKTSGDSKSIIDFGRKLGVDMVGIEVDKLIPRMIRGVAGCEGGCPADAQSLVKDGFGRFDLSYIEGGILSAVCGLEDGKSVSVRIFPEFD